jgi:hypothetical protein
VKARISSTQTGGNPGSGARARTLSGPGLVPDVDARYAGPRHAFVLWLRSVEAIDYKAATKARQELAKRYGILVSLSSRRSKGGA